MMKKFLAGFAALAFSGAIAYAANVSLDGNLILGGQIAANGTDVNLIGMTSGATTVVPIVAPAGGSADTNIGIAINGKGTGSVYLGGSTAANAAASVAHGTTNVNQIILTGTNTGTVPSIAVGGSGADANRNLNVAGVGTGIVTLGQAICTVSGSTPQTCNGQRGIVTTGSLSTAAATDATPYVINNSSVTASSLVVCTVNAYSGTYSTNGNPVIESCVPGSGTITVNLRNVNAANALSGTVAMGFAVLN